MRLCITENHPTTRPGQEVLTRYFASHPSLATGQQCSDRGNMRQRQKRLMIRTIRSQHRLAAFVRLSRVQVFHGPPLWFEPLSKRRRYNERHSFEILCEADAPSVNVRGTTRLTSAAIGEVHNRVCDMVIWLMSAKAMFHFNNYWRTV